jgi:hypothetical protein
MNGQNFLLEMATMVLMISHELKRLVDDYYRCENPDIQKEIHDHIKLLSDALFLCDQPEV